MCIIMNSMLTAGVYASAFHTNFPAPRNKRVSYTKAAAGKFSYLDHR